MNLSRLEEEKKNFYMQLAQQSSIPNKQAIKKNKMMKMINSDNDAKTDFDLENNKEYARHMAKAKDVLSLLIAIQDETKRGHFKRAKLLSPLRSRLCELKWKIRKARVRSAQQANTFREPTRLTVPELLTKLDAINVSILAIQTEIRQDKHERISELPELGLQREVLQEAIEAGMILTTLTILTSMILP